MPRYMANFGDKDRSIDQPELFIAATALEHDLTLVTRNLRDFQRVPGLNLYESI
jgi:predicted nucleic acid-binding protein